MKNVVLLFFMVACSVASYAATVKMATESFVTNEIHNVMTNLSDMIDKASGSKPVAMFILTLNEADETQWQCIELKASTNNFSASSWYDKLCYYSHTTHPDGGTYQSTTFDGVGVFVTSRTPEGRSYIGVDPGTTPISGEKMVILIVDTSKCIRSDGKWLYDGNENVTWVYIRGGGTGREHTQGGENLWRPCAPVKWFREVPFWAANR